MNLILRVFFWRMLSKYRAARPAPSIDKPLALLLEIVLLYILPMPRLTRLSANQNQSLHLLLKLFLLAVLQKMNTKDSVTKSTNNSNTIIKLSLFLLLAFGSMSIKVEKGNPPIVILRATKQDWAGGMVESGFGTKYTIQVKINTADKIDFLKMWLRNDSVPLQAHGKVWNHDTRLGKGDTVTLSYELVVKPHVLSPDLTADSTKARLAAKHSLPPFKYAGQALIQYTWNGWKKYTIVKLFKQLEPLDYP